MTVEILKQAILSGQHQLVKSMIDSNPSLLNAKDPTENRPMICTFLVANTRSSIEFLVFPLAYPELDWTLKSIHTTILSVATTRGTDLLTALKTNENFMNGHGGKTICELAIENQVKYQKPLDRALKMKDSPPKEGMIRRAQAKLDASKNIVEFFNNLNTNSLQQNKLPVDHVKEENVENNIVSHLSMFNSYLEEYERITREYHQKQIATYEEDFKGRVKLVEEVEKELRKPVSTEKSRILFVPSKNNRSKQEERECTGCTIS